MPGWGAVQVTAGAQGLPCRGAEGADPVALHPQDGTVREAGRDRPVPEAYPASLTTATAARTHCEQRFSLRKLYPDPLSGTFCGAGAKACSGDARWGNACVSPLVRDHSERTLMWTRGEHTGRTLGCIRCLHTGGRDLNQRLGATGTLSSPLLSACGFQSLSLMSFPKRETGTEALGPRPDRECWRGCVILPTVPKLKALAGLSWALHGSRARPGSASCSWGWRVL